MTSNEAASWNLEILILKEFTFPRKCLIFLKGNIVCSETYPREEDIAIWLLYSVTTTLVDSLIFFIQQPMFSANGDLRMQLLREIAREKSDSSHQFNTFFLGWILVRSSFKLLHSRHNSFNKWSSHFLHWFSFQTQLLLVVQNFGQPL